MSTQKRQTITADTIAQLFPGEAVQIGDQSILIHPLGLEQISTIVLKLDGIGAHLSDADVTWDNYTLPQSMFKIAKVVICNFADVLEEASNVRMEDLKQLPIEIIVRILEKVISVNLKSKEELEKNFKSLTENFLKETKPTKKSNQKRRK